MHVQLIAPQPSSHPLFQNRTEVPRGDLEWGMNNHVDRKGFRRSGSPRFAYLTFGRVGQLIGILESLSGIALEGEITVTLSKGTYRMEGTLSLFQPSYQSIVEGTLGAAERIARLLALDPDSQLENLTLTYTQELTKIGGNC